MHTLASHWIYDGARMTSSGHAGSEGPICPRNARAGSGRAGTWRPGHLLAVPYKPVSSCAACSPHRPKPQARAVARNEAAPITLPQPNVCASQRLSFRRAPSVTSLDACGMTEHATHLQSHPPVARRPHSHHIALAQPGGTQAARVSRADMCPRRGTAS